MSKHTKPSQGKTVAREESGERKPRLPHEHDESADSQDQHSRRPDIEQAYEDVESGQEDTDLRGTGGKRTHQVPPSHKNPKSN